MIDRMRADHERDRHRLAGGGARLIDRAQVARRVEIDAGLGAAAQHQAADADIGEAGLRIDDEIGRRRDIGRAVGAVLEMHGQRGEIGVGAGQHDLLRRRLGARDLDDLGLVAHALLDFAQQLARRDAEGARDARAAAGDAADQLLALGPGRLEQHRARISFQRLRHIGEVGRAAADLQLVRGKLFDEPAQPEAVEVAGRRRADGVALVDDVHERLSCGADYSANRRLSHRGPPRVNAASQRPATIHRQSRARIL